MRQKNWSPPVLLSRLPTAKGSITVVRDDRLKGGTKQRAAIPCLQHMINEGAREFVYASPFSGFAQIALAVSCEAINVRCTIFAQQQGTAASKFTSLAAQTAKVCLCESLQDAERQADEYVASDKQRMKIPLGFNFQEYREELHKSLDAQWRLLCGQLNLAPRVLWLPVGSGTLAHVFRSVVPPRTHLACVDVGVLPKTDPRIMSVQNLWNTSYHKVPEEFSEAVKIPPPIPSNLYYDAKLWQFVRKNACPLDVWWNVAS